MVNFPEDFMNIFTLNPLCLQDAMVNGSNWRLYAAPFHRYSFSVSMMMSVILHLHFPLHCLGGGDKQCNAEEGDVRLFHPKKQLLHRALNVAVSG